MSYPLLIIFALAPGIIWLLFFLRKDAHPESKSMILKIFLYGMLATLPAIFIESGFSQEVAKLPISVFPALLLNIFVGVALVEEFLKYLVVRDKVFKSPELDEPLDVMLYMIISALGFATLENLLIFLPLKRFFLDFSKIFILAGFRFVSATFLHALCSGSLGYFLALSFYRPKKQIKFLVFGFFLAIALHGFYNFSIIKIEENLERINEQIIITNPLLFFSSLVIVISILVSLGIFVTIGFKKLKKIKGICKIE